MNTAIDEAYSALRFAAFNMRIVIAETNPKDSASARDWSVSADEAIGDVIELFGRLDRLVSEAKAHGYFA
jgi:hypothetical protein